MPETNTIKCGYYSEAKRAKCDLPKGHDERHFAEDSMPASVKREAKKVSARPIEPGNCATARSPFRRPFNPYR